MRSIVSYFINTFRALPGAREPGGGGGKGAIAPPNFLSQWDGYACAPLKFGNH